MTSPETPEEIAERILDNGTASSYLERAIASAIREAEERGAKKERGALGEFFRDLASKQKPLGREFEAALYDNLWDLYVRDDKNEQGLP